MVSRFCRQAGSGGPVRSSASSSSGLLRPSGLIVAYVYLFLVSGVYLVYLYMWDIYWGIGENRRNSDLLGSYYYIGDSERSALSTI